MLVGALVPHHTDRAHRQQHDEGLGHPVVPAGLTQLADVQREFAATLGGGLVAADSYRALAGTVAGVAAGVASGCVTLRNAIDKPTSELAPTDEPTARLAASSMRHGVIAMANRTRRYATQARVWALRERRQDVLDQHVAVDGEDLRLVAFLHLGDPTRWRDIATFNHLQGSTLSGGQLVLIPAEGVS